MKKASYHELYLAGYLGCASDEDLKIFIDVDFETAEVTYRAEPVQVLFNPEKPRVLGVVKGSKDVVKGPYFEKTFSWDTDPLLLSGTCEIHSKKIEWEPVKIEPCSIFSEILELEAEIVLEKNFCFYAENYSRFNVKLTVHDIKVEKVSVIKTERYVYSGLGDPARFRGSFSFYVKEEIVSILGFMTKQVCWGLEAIGFFLVKRNGEIVACPCPFN